MPDSLTSGNDTTGAVNVEAYVFVRVLSLKIEKLGNNNISHLVINGHAQHDNALSQQERVDIKGSLPPGTTFNYHRNNIHRLIVHLSPPISFYMVQDKCSLLHNYNLLSGFSH
ncbi:unnamed protein product, partial [marine sediment metagenome]